MLTLINTKNLPLSKNIDYFCNIKKEEVYMKRKSYARDHITLRLTFEEVSVLSVQILSQISEDRCTLEQSLTPVLRRIVEHRAEVLQRLYDIIKS